MSRSRCWGSQHADVNVFYGLGAALEESANLPTPEAIAQEIAADLEAALEQFATIADDLK